MVTTEKQIVVFSVRLGQFTGGVICEGQTITAAPPYIRKTWLGRNIVDLSREFQKRGGKVVLV